MTVGNTIMIFMILSLIVTLILLFFINPIVSIMSTPVEAIQETTLYLKICFIGIPFITAYNIISSIFRGLGDSKRPMYFVAVACFFNIVLDFIFIGYFNMHAVGAALGTVISQLISVIVALFAIIKRKLIVIHRYHLKLHKKLLKISLESVFLFLCKMLLFKYHSLLLRLSQTCVVLILPQQLVL